MKKLFPSIHTGGLFLLLIFSANLIQAQDPVFSQYFANRMYLNPAMTGFEGGISVNMNRRDQWRKIAQKESKFVTQAVGLEMEIPCLQSAIGLTYMENVEGEGFLRWQSAGIAAAVGSKPKNPNDKFEFRGGFKGNYNWRSLNWDNFVFSDQLNAIYGITGPTQLPIAMNSDDYGSFFDLNSGIAISGSFTGDDRFTVGAAINHIVRVNNSMLDDTLAPRTTLHFTYVTEVGFSRKRSYYFSPMIKWDFQKSSQNPDVLAYNSLIYGAGFSSQQTPGIWAGMWMQHRGIFPHSNNTNSLITLLGYEFKTNKSTTRVGISYDYNFSGITSNGNGTFELSLVTNISDIDLFGCSSKSKGRIPCPKF